MRIIHWSALVVMAGGIALSACGGDGDATSETAPSATTSPAEADFNTSDVMFAQGMIPHHAQAVEMASIALAPEREASAEVQDLAQRIQSAQDPEIEQMTQFLISWDQPVDMPTMDGMEMDGMVAAEEIDTLSELRGADFDALWSRLMIAHHEGAIVMAKTEIADGLNPDAITLAKVIVAAQEAEIDELGGLGT